MKGMKDSGIDWIGKIPEHWKAGKIFYYLEDIGSGTTPSGEDYYTEGGINWLNTGDLTDGYITNIPKKITPKAMEDFSTLKLHDKNSIVIAMYGATIGKLGILTEKTTTNQACCVMTPNKDLSYKFLFYCLYAGKDYMMYLSFGSGQPNINQNILRHFIIPHIPIEEQQAIADYLDGECARINGIVTTQRQIIERLKEYKKSVITEVVTRGLNPNAPMKDSGIEWIGKIPEHWKIRKMKYIFEIIGGNGFPEEIQGLESGEFPFCKCSDINSSDIYLDKAKNYVESDIVTKLKLNVIPEYSILMSKIGEALKKNHRKINRVKCIVDNNMEALSPLCADFCILFLYFLTTIIDMMWFDNAGTIPSVNNNKLRNFKVVFPPLSEQQAIADYLDRECARIDTIIEKRERMIELMTEYKKSLIYECVTGKKEIVDVVE